MRSKKCTLFGLAVLCLGWSGWTDAMAATGTRTASTPYREVVAEATSDDSESSTIDLDALLSDDEDIRELDRILNES